MKPLPGRFRLRSAYISSGKKYLPLEIREIYHIKIDDSQMTYAGGGQIGRHRIAKATSADDQN